VRQRTYPAGMNACPGHHPDRAGLKQIGDPFCRPCLFALPSTTRHLVTSGMPPGAWVAYRDEVIRQIAAGKALDQIHLSTTSEENR
jgi:hypothetical protein